MFCPQCGISQSDELRFCTSCGTNLYDVRQVVTSGKTEKRLNWDARLAEITQSQNEQRKNAEIKAGVITSCVGVGIMIFLYFFMQGIPGNAAILGRLWLAGLIPFFVGIGQLINGLFVNKQLPVPENMKIQNREKARELAPAAKDKISLSSDNWHEPVPQPSVTENTTRHLNDSGQR